MHSLDEQIIIYQRYHTKESTKILHYIAIPALYIASLIFLNWFYIGFATRWHISFAWLLTFGILIYYYFLQVRLALLMTIILCIITALITWFVSPMPTKYNFIAMITLFIIGTGCQLISHTVEPHKPDLVKSLSQLFVMPLLLTIEVLKGFKLGQYFELEEV